MENQSGDRFTIITIVVILIACIVAIVAVVSYMWGIVRDPVTNFFDSFGSGVSLRSEQIDYAFVVPGENLDESSPDSEQQSEVPNSEQPTPNTSDEPEVTRQIDYAFFIPSRKPYENQNKVPLEDAIVADATDIAQIRSEYYETNSVQITGSVRIPRLGFRSSIVSTPDVELALEQGLWQVPTDISMSADAGITTLCRRHYFGTEDGRSCWYLDYLQEGDRITLQLGEGDALNEYEITFVTEVSGNISEFYTVRENTLRIITTAPLYSNERRLVVEAERVRD